MLWCENPKGRYVCGKCPACIQKKASEKYVVSHHAAVGYMTQGQFLTLTYSDEHRPDGLNHKHFSDLMKMLRHRDATPGVKYFMAGEYGEKNGREHFHVLFYNHKYDLGMVEREWSKGFVYDGTLTPASMKYVTGYINKKGYDPESGKRKPYGRFSVNIADDLSEEEIVQMCRTGHVYLNGSRFSVPRSWRYRYRELWDYYSDERNRLYSARKSKMVDDYYKTERKPLTADYIRGMMYYREQMRALKRG